MRLSIAVFRALAACATFTLLAGCGGNLLSAARSGGAASDGGARSVPEQVSRTGGTIARVFGRNLYVSSAALPTLPSFLSPDALGKPLVFISVQGSSGHIDIYQTSEKPKLVGEITGVVPEGIATDTAGNLYVANGLGSSATNVLVFASPYTGAPKLTLTDPGSAPLGVAVSNVGLVAVGNDNGTIAFYSKNSTHACATVANAAKVAQVFSAAFDSKGVLYIVAYDTNFNPILGKVVGGCNAKTITLLTTVNTIGSASAVKIATGGRVAILDANLGAIDTYDAPKANSLGSPISKTPLKFSPTPFAFAFLASGLDIYALNYNGVAGEFAYPSGGVPGTTITIKGAGNGTPTGGIAVFPPLVP